jgi:hypothetical protein
MNPELHTIKEHHELCQLIRQHTPDGEWNQELDFQFFYSNYMPCIIKRNKALLNWCGYVGIAPGSPFYGHPAYTLDYNDIHNLFDIDVHGGLTYSGPFTLDLSRKELEDYWWIGFDCAHCFDLIPGMSRFGKMLGDYRNQDYVTNEVKSLAKQINAIGRVPFPVLYIKYKKAMRSIKNYVNNLRQKLWRSP